MTDEDRLVEQVISILSRWHQNTCYPQAARFELESGADQIIAALRSRPDPDDVARLVEAAAKITMQTGNEEITLVYTPDILSLRDVLAPFEEGGRE